MFGAETKLPIVMCPVCDQTMKAIERKAVAFSNGLIDVTYVCETCSTHTVRTIKPDYRSRHGGDVGEPGVDETDQRCLMIRSGATAAGAVVCLDTSPAWLAALVGVRGRRAVQNDLTAPATAALTSA